MGTNIFRDFFVISRWETVVILLFIIIFIIGLWYLIRKFKLKFHWRVLIALGVGLIFGISLSAAGGFPGQDTFDPMLNPRWGPFSYGFEIDAWLGLISTIFIAGLMIMIVPIVFLSMARIVSKVTTSNLKGVTWKGLLVLLINVAVAFTVTFWIALALLKGQPLNLASNNTGTTEPLKALPKLFSDYIPNNFFLVLGTVSVIPALLLGTIVGYAIKKLSKHNEKAMETSRENLDRYWKIAISVLMIFVKFMPYAIFAMMARAIFSRPIGEFATIGIIIAAGYIGLILTFIWQAATVWLFGIKAKTFYVKGFKPIFSGFLTQSSLATLPLSIEALQTDMKLGKNAIAPNVIAPLSTTMALSGCGGVQGGIVLALLYQSTSLDGMPIVTMSLGVFFIVGLIVTMFVSLGIAGVPGTAQIVSIGLMSTLGFGAYINSLLGVIAPLNGIFDMGRTAVNVGGGLQASLIAAQLSGEAPPEIQGQGPLGPLARKIGQKSLVKKHKTSPKASKVPKEGNFD